ncbi:hypothetical protein [Brevibacillus nitrificans]|uniref:hypothetical protein n=1 Tax=Brevibacillus nitrificans TaxID=651560 RepID=UPI00260EF1C4|nr:hypothetical protein [Brevibacillus nitrificans]MED1795161.1 hypothetical protein [Brevibacillus nitrificans]
MNNKLIIRKSQKTILTVNIKEAKSSALGELDIMIDSVRGIPFTEVVAGNYHEKFSNEIESITWHGYYKIDNRNKVKIPTVHFKYDRAGKVTTPKDIKHIGTINANEPFAFPLCSLYIPVDDQWLNSVQVSNYPANRKDLQYHFKDVSNLENKRLDIFITPKGVSATKVMDGILGSLYTFADVPIFNTVDGRLIPLKEIQNKPEFDQKSTIEIISLGNGHDIIIRTVGDQQSMFSELEGKYSLLIHDPNDALNRIANRFFVKFDEESGETQEIGIIKDTLEVPREN